MHLHVREGGREVGRNDAKDSCTEILTITLHIYFP